MEDDKKLQDQIDVLIKRREKLNADKFLSDELPKILALVGRYFVYKDNSYGGLETWNMYYKILHVSVSNNQPCIISKRIQIDSHLCPSIEITEFTIMNVLVETTKEKWEKELKKVEEQLNHPTQLIKSYEKTYLKD